MIKKSDNKLINLPNIGKVLSGKMEKIGLKTADDFLKQDSFEVFTKLLRVI